MNGKDTRDWLDELVRRSIERREEDLDAEAFLARLSARRRTRSRRIIVLRVATSAIAAAAVLLLVLNVFLAAPSPDVSPVEPKDWSASLVEPAGSAWRGATSACGAALGAGKTALLQVAQVDFDPNDLAVETDALVRKITDETRTGFRQIIDLTRSALREETVQ